MKQHRTGNSSCESRRRLCVRRSARSVRPHPRPGQDMRSLPPITKPFLTKIVVDATHFLEISGTVTAELFSFFNLLISFINPLLSADEVLRRELLHIKAQMRRILDALSVYLVDDLGQGLHVCQNLQRRHNLIHSKLNYCEILSFSLHAMRCLIGGREVEELKDRNFFLQLRRVAYFLLGKIAVIQQRRGDREPRDVLVTPYHHLLDAASCTGSRFWTTPPLSTPIELTNTLLRPRWHQ